MVPIVRQGELAGYVASCGKVEPGDEPEYFLMAKVSGVPEDELRELGKQSPEGDPKSLSAMADELFETLNS